MEISDIKQQLTIGQVLQHYGLKPDKSNRLVCPFHNDKTPSMQIYPITNTYCCFSSNCTAGTGDVIQFIQLKENCTKHEALIKATVLITGNTIAPQPTAAKLFIEETDIDRIAVLTKFFAYYKTGLPRVKKAVDYLQSRCIDYKIIEAAFNSGGLHQESKHHHLTESMVKVGLLKPLPVSGYSVWAKDCIIFPLKNADHKIISLYGRSITNDTDQRHFYLQNRSGLYPGYPSVQTKKLILTESIIDAASLLQQEAIKSHYEILSLYGTNGLTEEHIKAITALPQLEEIILMLNADDAGNAATDKHAHALHALLPQVHITRTSLPTGEN